MELGYSVHRYEASRAPMAALVSVALLCAAFWRSLQSWAAGAEGPAAHNAQDQHAPPPLSPPVLERVLLRPGWSPLAAAAAPSQQPRCLFVYAPPLLPFIQHGAASEQPAWLYGARLEATDSATLATPTGRAENVLRGRLLCWDSDTDWQRQLRATARLLPREGWVRPPVQVVLQNGQPARACCYLACPIARATRPALGGVVFDMDGTLVKPSIDFKSMYARCGIPNATDILREIESLPPEKRACAHKVILEEEEAGRHKMELVEGALEIGEWLKAHGVPMALLTRNSLQTALHFESTFWLPERLPRFYPLLARDVTPAFPPKPDPAAVLHCADTWGIPASSVLMVGDSRPHDIVCGNRAGVATALVNTALEKIHGKEWRTFKLTDDHPDLTCPHLQELPRAIWKHFEMERPVEKSNAHLSTISSKNAKKAVQALEALLDDVFALHSTTEPALTDSVNRLSTPDHHGNSPLIYASYEGRVDLVEKLLELSSHVCANPQAQTGVRTYSKETESRTSRNGNRSSGVGQAQKKLARACLDLDFRGAMGRTALSHASEQGHAPVVQVLLRAGADPMIPSAALHYPAHLAAKNGHIKVLRLLLAHPHVSSLVFDRTGILVRGLQPCTSQVSSQTSVWSSSPNRDGRAPSMAAYSWDLLPCCQLLTLGTYCHALPQMQVRGILF
eukprot:g42069.t1